MQSWTSLLARVLDLHDAQDVPQTIRAEQLLGTILQETGFTWGVVLPAVAPPPLALVGGAWNAATGGFFAALPLEVEADRGLAATVLRRGAAVVTAAPRSSEASAAAGLMLGLPLSADGRVWGVLGLAGSPRGEPAELLEVFEPIARAASRLLRPPAAADDALLDALQRSEAILEHMPDGVLSIDLNGRVLTSNKAAQRIFGYSPEEMADLTILRLLPPGATVGAEAMETGDTRLFGVEHEMIGQRADGSTFPMEITIARGRHDQRPIFIWIVRDVSRLQRVERELEHFFSLTPELLALVSSEGYFTRLNHAWERTLGLPQEALLSSPYMSFVHPEDRAATLREFSRVLQGRGAERFENRYRCGDGTYRWLQWTAIFDEDSRVVFAAARDVTEQRALREAITQQNEDLERYSAGLKRLHRLTAAQHATLCDAVYEYIQVGLDFLCMDAAGIFALEDGLFRLTYTLGDAPWDLAPHSSQELGLGALEEGLLVAWPLRESSRRRVSSAARRDGSVFLAAPLRWERELGAALVFQSSSERRLPLSDYELDIMELMVESLGRVIAAHQVQEARAQADAERQRLSAVLEATPDFVAMLQADGRLLFLNQAGRRLMGLTQEVSLQAQHLTAPLTIQAHRTFTEQALPLAQERGVWSGELTLRTAHGEPLPCAALLLAHRTPEGQIAYFSLICHDISALKELDRLKDEFVSTVSHELRTPLTSIRGSLGLLAGGVMGPLPEDAQELIAIAQSNAERLIRLINDILDLDKMESQQMSFDIASVEIPALVRTAVDGLGGAAAQAGVTLRTQVPERLEAQGDADRLLQVLINLIGNAIKFSPAASQITVQAARAAQGGVHVQVTDQGPGIPPEARARLFQRFQQLDGAATRQKGGTGLGLAISKAIIDAHGGEIGVFNADAGGATFYFTLPPPFMPLDRPSG